MRTLTHLLIVAYAVGTSWVVYNIIVAVSQTAEITISDVESH